MHYAVHYSYEVVLMSDQDERPEGSGWVLEPQGRAGLYIAVGNEAVLRPEVREALDELMRVLEQQDEVAGFAAGGPDPCGIFYTCTRDVDCRPLTRVPCYAFETCRVQPFSLT
jgi:hypothetical protein